MTVSSPLPCEATRAHSLSSTSRSSSGSTLAASILGSSLAFVDGSVVNVALPALDNSLDAGAEGLPWLVSAYLLTLSSLILLGGALGDHYGRRRIFLGGIVLFLVASLGCASAQSLGTMLTARALQGVGAALLLPNSLALLGANFSGEAKGRAIGTWAGVGALAGVIAPLLGGWLVDYVGWRSIFLINLPIGLGALWLGWRYVEESRDRREGATLDLLGALLITAALALLTWALTAAGGSSGFDANVLAATGGGLALLAAFLAVELKRDENALMPLFLMRDRSFLGVTLLTFLLYAALAGLITLLPFVLIKAQDYSPRRGGRGDAADPDPHRRGLARHG